MINKIVFLLLALSLAWSPCVLRAAEAEKIPILLDTDIGSDVDDAFALTLILDSPEFDLLGVTTVSGDTVARARLAAKMLDVAGRPDIPVAAGEPGKPLPIEQSQWADGFKSPALLTTKAVDFLQDQIDHSADPVTLIAIGPLTNVAALLNQDPAAAKRIKVIALMGGSVYRGYQPGSPPEPEYNIKLDPEAARIVFSSGVPILMAPLDSTSMLKLDAAARQRIFTNPSPLAKTLEPLYRLWNHETPTLFDPMPIALLLDPSLCETKSLAIEVDAKGFTRVVQGKPANATVAVQADSTKFFTFYLNRVAP
jgi:inosine-uridine nucleoside N-ribohydrolase